MNPFGSHPDGVAVRVGDDHLLALELLPDLLDSVGAAEGDPALSRLTPSAYPDDPEAQEEYGRMINPELEREREADRRILDNLLAARERIAGSEETKRKSGKSGTDGTSETTVLGQEETESLLRVMNESRLTLAARLQIEDDIWEKMPARPNEEAPAMMLLRYLTYLQEALIDALTAPAPD